MNAVPSSAPARDWRTVFLCGTLTATLLYFFAFYHWPPPSPRVEPRSALHWLYLSWNYESYHWKYGWLTALAIVICIIVSVGRGWHEPVTRGRAGLIWIFAGLLLWFMGQRSLQMRFLIFSLPFLILGTVHFVAGWKRARHFLFPLSLTFFLVPWPWMNRLTNYFIVPLRELKLWFFELLGGKVSHPYYLDSMEVPFPFLIPVVVAALILAKYDCRSFIERFVVIALALPVAFLTEAVRGALMAWMHWMNIDWFQRSGLHQEIELLLVLTLSVIYFFTALWLVERTRRWIQKGKSSRLQPLPQ